MTQDSSECPQETKITIPNVIEELTQNITISFSPSLTASLPSSFFISAEDLVQKHLSLNFKRKGEPEKPLTILKSTLTDDTDSSNLVIQFLEKMRSSNTESISISVKEAWIYSPSADGQASSRPVYFKQNKKVSGEVTEKRETAQERDEKNAAQIGRYVRTSILGIVAATSLTVGFIGSATFLAYFVKFFNIVDILSNIAKINVELGPRFTLVMSFIDSLKIPEISFIANLSPIQDSHFDEPDVDAYKSIPRGTRGKITESNEDVFIIAGQNFAVSIVIILLWCLGRLLELCLTDGSKIIGFFSFAYQLMIDLFFFDYQMICASEISFFNYNKIRERQGKFVQSILISMFILVLVLREFSAAFESIREEIQKKRVGDKKEKELSKANQLTLEIYTEGVNLDQKQKGSTIHLYLLWIGNLRFFIIQLIISALQLLSRSQALFVLVVNLSYFIFFLKTTFTSKVFSSKLMLVKESIQETCIMVVLAALTIFSFTEKSAFSSSSLFEIIEILAVVSILGASGSEFVMLCQSILESFKSCFSRKKKKKSTILNAKNSSEGFKSVEMSPEVESEDNKAVWGNDQKGSRNEHRDVSTTANDDPFAFLEEKIEVLNSRKETVKIESRRIIGRFGSGIGSTAGLDDREDKKRGVGDGRTIKFGLKQPKRSRVKFKSKMKFDIVEKR